jgi:hypothetical protein
MADFPIFSIQLQYPDFMESSDWKSKDEELSGLECVLAH